jgi:hypothetical protein
VVFNLFCSWYTIKHLKFLRYTHALDHNKNFGDALRYPVGFKPHCVQLYELSFSALTNKKKARDSFPLIRKYVYACLQFYCVSNFYVKNDKLKFLTNNFKYFLFMIEYSFFIIRSQNICFYIF